MKHLLFFIVSLFVFSACVGYEGTPVSTAHPGLCQCFFLPASCNNADSYFSMNYKIQQDTKNNYMIDGIAKYIGTSSWEVFNQASFILFLINNGKVVDTVTVPGGSGSLSSIIKLKKKFTTEKQFDTVLLSYKMQVRG